MEKDTKPAGTPPPIIPDPKEPRSSNKVLIAVIIIIGIIMAILAVDYFIGKDNNLPPVDSRGETVQKPNTNTVKQNVIDTVKQIPEQTTEPIPSDSSTLNKANEGEKPIASTPKKVSEENKPATINKISSTIQPVLPTAKSKVSTVQLNGLLDKITSSDDYAMDEIRKVLGNSLKVEGAANISNVQELITDVSKGSRYKVTKINTDASGKVVSISVSK